MSVISPQENKDLSAPGSVSAFIVCCNEEEQIGRCLESIKWCDEIVIVDSGSTDRTLDICKNYNTRIVQRRWPGFVEQKRYALSLCRCEWVLNIDADEEVSPELKDEIKQRMLEEGAARPAGQVDGFELLRVVFYMGRWWRRGGWYPEYRLRLCRKSKTTWGGEDPHERAIIDGRVHRLKHELRHYTYGNLTEQVTSLNSLSSSAAQSLFKKGQRTGLAGLIARPLGRFFKFYVLKGGFEEGLAGLIVALTEAGYVFLKYAKLWELWQRFGETEQKQ